MSHRPGPRINIRPAIERPNRSSALLPEWLHESLRLPSPHSFRNPDLFIKSRPTFRKRMVHAGLALILLMGAAAIAVQIRGRQSIMEVNSRAPWIAVEMEPQEELSMWGRTEGMGWRQHAEVGLAVLGEAAEDRYRLKVSAGQDGMIESVHYYTNTFCADHDPKILYQPAFIRQIPSTSYPSTDYRLSSLTSSSIAIFSCSLRSSCHTTETINIHDIVQKHPSDR